MAVSILGENFFLPLRCRPRLICLPYCSDVGSFVMGWKSDELSLKIPLNCACGWMPNMTMNISHRSSCVLYSLLASSTSASRAQQLTFFIFCAMALQSDFVIVTSLWHRFYNKATFFWVQYITRLRIWIRLTWKHVTLKLTSWHRSCNNVTFFS